MAFDLREIWRNRELLYFFVWRDLKVRYKQTAFGALWALIQPLALMLVFTLVFGNVEGIAPAGVPYPLFALVGPGALDALLAEPDRLVGQPRRGRERPPEGLLPAAPAAGRGGRAPTSLDFVIGMVVLLALMVIMGVLPTLAALWVLPLTLLARAGLAGRRHLALGAQRALPRRPLRGPVPGPGLALRLAGRLLGRARPRRTGA